MKYPLLIILNNENVIVPILIRHISNFNNNSAMLIFYGYVKIALKFYIYVNSAPPRIVPQINFHFF